MFGYPFAFGFLDFALDFSVLLDVVFFGVSSVRVDLCILYFAHMLGAFLHIHLYMYYIYVAFGPLVIQAVYYPNMVSEHG